MIKSSSIAAAEIIWRYPSYWSEPQTIFYKICLCKVKLGQQVRRARRVRARKVKAVTILISLAWRGRIPECINFQVNAKILQIWLKNMYIYNSLFVECNVYCSLCGKMMEVGLPAWGRSGQVIRLPSTQHYPLGLILQV